MVPSAFYSHIFANFCVRWQTRCLVRECDELAATATDLRAQLSRSHAARRAGEAATTDLQQQVSVNPLQNRGLQPQAYLES